MGLVGHPRSMSYANGRGAGGGEDRFSLRSYEVPSTSLDPREVSLLSPSRRPYLSSSRSTDVHYHHTFESNGFPANNRCGPLITAYLVNQGIRSIPKLESLLLDRALVSPEISTPGQTIVYYFFFPNFPSFLTLLQILPL